jgi:hypothetical protein
VQEIFKAPWAQGATGVLEDLAAQLRKAFIEARKGGADVLDAQVGRTLVEGRHYRKRTVFGQPRLVGLLSSPGTPQKVPAYLPETLSKELPAFRQMGVRMIAEVRPQAEDGLPHPSALRVVALGRVVNRAL